MSDAINTLEGPEESATPQWRQRAVELAVEKALVGRAWKIHVQDVPGLASYTVPSSTHRYYYQVLYSTKTGTIGCECEAGQHKRPCAHAGATLLLICRLAPEARVPGTPREMEQNQ